VEESHAAVEASKEEYNTLKERTKVVASELKERRAACRTLASEADMLKSKNSNLQDQITQMQGESLDMNQSSQANEKGLNTLKSQLMDMKKELEEARAGMQKVAEKGDEALTSYKKKAQQSLAVANARAANAAQAREEAEMESRAARSTADKAMERAMMAEQNGKEAQAKAKLYVTDMEKEVAKYSEVKEALEKATLELEQVRAESESLTETNAKQTCELQSVSGRYEASQKTVEDLKKELSESQVRANEFFEETERLRHEIQRLKDDFQRLSLAMESNDAEEKKEYVEQAKQVSLNSEAEATISMLRQDLNDANIAIKELKETLRATVEALSNPQSQPSPSMNGDAGGSIPLFYAMEKQAELTQARNEIARLANLLGDSETDKQQAMDSMQDMEQRMNEAMAKLRRQEHHDKLSPQEEQVNMEYLKNVTLSFVNATTLVQKKALLPVIGTVLCLTPEEQRRAMEALDKNGSGVMESVTSSVLSLGWGS
jgi:DNA repair exonuclease SbcCD ATPase subunit